MKKPILFLVLGSLFFAQCSKSDSPTPEKPDVNDVEAIDLTTIDNGNRAMMQTFYWDVTPIGNWWNITAERLADWNANGIDRIWLPVATKGQSGSYSMGYDPSDYFDFGEYDQHGTTETRFGSRAELENLIAKAHSLNMEVIADIVLGHNSGGESNTIRFVTKIPTRFLMKKTGMLQGNLIAVITIITQMIIIVVTMQQTFSQNKTSATIKSMCKIGFGNRTNP